MAKFNNHSKLAPSWGKGKVDPPLACGGDGKGFEAQVFRQVQLIRNRFTAR